MRFIVRNPLIALQICSERYESEKAVQDIIHRLASQCGSSWWDDCRITCWYSKAAIFRSLLGISKWVLGVGWDWEVQRVRTGMISKCDSLLQWCWFWWFDELFYLWGWFRRGRSCCSQWTCRPRSSPCWCRRCDVDRGSPFHDTTWNRLCAFGRRWHCFMKWFAFWSVPVWLLGASSCTLVCWISLWERAEHRVVWTAPSWSADDCPWLGRWNLCCCYCSRLTWSCPSVTNQPDWREATWLRRYFCNICEDVRSLLFTWFNFTLALWPFNFAYRRYLAVHRPSTVLHLFSLFPRPDWSGVCFCAFYSLSYVLLWVFVSETFYCYSFVCVLPIIRTPILKHFCFVWKEIA